MSLAINTTTPEGIVFATDSRQSFRNRKGMARIGSDNASKLFQINSRVGVAVTGLAFLPEGGVMKNISKFIDEFRHEVDVEKLEVKEVADKLHYLFDKKYNYREQLKKLPEQIKADLQQQGCEVLEVKEEKNAVKFRFKDPQGQVKEGVGGVDMINLMVAGYNKDGNHEVYICYIPGEIQKKRDGKEKGKEYGASWIGQIDVVSRIVLGFDGRIGNLKFVNQIAQQGGREEIQKQLRSLEYVIQWGTMTIQDAIDFCTLMIQTTSAIQRFSDGVQGDPGDMPGVGGPVDVAVITPNKGFVWINKKRLSVGDVEVDLDKEPDLKTEPTHRPS
jgi:20S proteasome alpha/beta subunit